MSNPIVKIKTGNISNLYANNEHISNSNHLEPLEHGELAYNKNNNGLYIGYNGKNYLISAAFSNVENPSQNNDYQYFHGLADFAKNANVAVKLGTVDKGDTNTPIWLDNGEPREVTGLDLDTTGNAATATQWRTARDFSISGIASDTTIFSVNGTKNITLALPRTLSGFTSLSAGTFTGGVWNGTTIAVAYGGTGNTSQTKNRLIYSESASKLSSSGHYASSTKVAINSTTAPTEALYVNGNFKTYGNAYVDNGFISITRDGNPYIGLSDGANNWYYQSVKADNKVGLGPTWGSATKWDTSGNMYMPAKIEVTGEATFLGTIKASKIIPRETMNTAYLLGDAVNTWYNIYSRSLQIYDGTNKSDGGKIYTAVSAATTANATVAELGNSIKTGTANNRYGVLRLYSEGATCLNLAAYRYATDSATTEATARTIYLRDHGATAYLAATTTRSAVGSNVQPVYVTNSGVLTACKMPASGAWFNALPVIGPDGVVEIGRYIDFHSTNATTSDYSVRIDAGTGSQGNVLYLPDITGQVVIHTDNTAEGSASLPVYIAASGKATACTASSVFSAFTSTKNTLSITVTGQKRTASIVNSISNTWKRGTTSGPTLKTTVNGVAGTAVAIPSASDSASGVVTTGAQTFAGSKTFSSVINMNAGMNWAPNQNITCAPTAANQEWSFDVGSTSYAGSYWHVWSSVQSASILACYADNRRVDVPLHLSVGGYENSAYAISTNSFISNSWIRTVGNTGWYSETYGGGIYMTDSSWVQVYNKKNFKVTGQIFAYSYVNQGKNAPAIIFDKPGGNFTGIGANSETDTIFFGPVSSDGNYTWVSGYNQKWKFQGSLATTVALHSPILATSNYGTSNPSGTPMVGTLYFKQI